MAGKCSPAGCYSITVLSEASDTPTASDNLPPAELADIIARDPDPIEITCHNCGSVYHITKAMVRGDSFYI